MNHHFSARLVTKDGSTAEAWKTWGDGFKGQDAIGDPNGDKSGKERTANDTKLKALERYSYHALDIDAENDYVGSDYQHNDPDDGYRIDPGHYLVNESVLSKPFEMCTNLRQEVGDPFIVTEKS